VVVGLYVVAGVAVWGHVWFGGHPTTELTCGCGDPAQAVWFLRWFPFAVAHGHNPLYSTWLFAPRGFNLLDSTSILLPAAVLSPVTVLVGPVAALNVGLTLAPAVTASCTYLALRRWVDWRPAAFVGGLLFGFSPMVLSNLTVAHLHVALLCFPPLMLLLLDDLVVTQRMGWRRAGVLLALVVVGQFFVGTEVLVMCGLLAAGGVVLVACSHRHLIRRHLPYAARGLGLAAAAGAVVLAYPVWFAVAGPTHFTGVYWPDIAETDATLRQIVDAGASHAVQSSSHLVGYWGPVGPPYAYLGPLLVVVLVAGAVALRRLRVLWFCGAMYAWSTVLGLGVAATVRSGRIVGVTWLPWNAFRDLSLTRNVLPVRFAGLGYLFVALALGVVLDRAHGRALRWWCHRPWAAHRPLFRRVPSVVVAVVGLLAVAPVVAATSLPFTEHPSSLPAWFDHQGRTVAPGSTLLAVPMPSTGEDEAALWQAQVDLRFRLVGGFGFVPAGSGLHPDYSGAGAAGQVLADYAPFYFGPLPTGTPGELRLVRSLIVSHGVDTVVVVDQLASSASAAGFLTAVLGRPPRWENGAWVWYDVSTVRSASPLPLPGGALGDCVAAAGPEASPLTVPDCVLAASGVPT